MTEDEMVGWHHRLNGHGFGWTPGAGDGQGCLAEKEMASHSSTLAWKIPHTVEQITLRSRASVQFSSVVQSCLTLCDPMDCRLPGFPVHHQLPELTQTHVH